MLVGQVRSVHECVDWSGPRRGVTAARAEAEARTAPADTDADLHNFRDLGAGGSYQVGQM